MIKKSLVALFVMIVFGTFLYYKPVVKDDFDIISELKKNNTSKVVKDTEYLSNNEISDD